MAFLIVVALFVAGLIDLLWLIDLFIFWILDDILAGIY